MGINFIDNICLSHINFRRQFLWLATFWLLPLISSAQRRLNTGRTIATYTVHLPGNIPLDRSGNNKPNVDTVFVIFMEISGTPPKWTIARINDHNYSISSILLKTMFYEGGIIHENGQKMIIQVSKGFRLWQLRLMPEESRSLIPLLPASGEIILQGTYHGKNKFKKITRMIELTSIPSV